MIKLKIEGNIFSNVECAFTNSINARNLLDMLSCIPIDKPYSINKITIETDADLLGNEYHVCDNSYCINIANNKEALLVQEKNNFYEPDAIEDGAKFFIVKKPYVQKIHVFTGDYFIIFVNVMSKKTGHIYRVIYNDDSVLA